MNQRLYNNGAQHAVRVAETHGPTTAFLLSAARPPGHAPEDYWEGFRDAVVAVFRALLDDGLEEARNHFDK